MATTHSPNQNVGISSTNGTPPLHPSMVRKCAGKNKSHECLQNSDHSNTRWECAFESTSKDEYFKHLKNLLKRQKWRELVDANKPDKDGFYRCVYFSTDRHHVENHYQKGSADPISPSPQQINRFKSYLNANRHPSFKRNFEDDGDGSPEAKKMKQDAALLALMQDSHMEAQVENREPVPDGTKIEDLLETIEKKLELPHEMTLAAIDKLHKQGFTIVQGLKSLNKDGWEKLELPLAMEEEIRNQITVSVSYPAFYPLYYSSHQPAVAGYWTGQYNSLGQPIFYQPTTASYQPSYESQETVIGEGEVSEKDKEVKAEKDVEIPHEQFQLQPGI